METDELNLTKWKTLILNCDADKLFKETSPDDKTIKDFCKIAEDLNPKSAVSGADISSYTTHVKRKQRISWIGESSDVNYTISIDSIVMMNLRDNKDFFNRSTLLGSGGIEGVVAGKIKDKGLEIGDIYTYKINFSITNLSDEGEPSKSYSLDPKLQIQ